MANAYFYSNNAIQTTLAGNISAGATSITVAATTGFPASFPYVLALDFGGATEELVAVTAAAGVTLTVTRGFGGTSAQSHSLGAVVRHVVNALDLTDFRTHEGATGDVHGVTGALVGATQSQTLTNKTLTSPTVNSPTITSGGSLGGTFTGTPTISGAALFTGNPIFQGAAASTVAASHRVTGDGTPRLQTQADGKLLWGPGNATADTVLQRAAADVLSTDDNFRSLRTAATDPGLSTRVAGDTNDRLTVQADGKLVWGTGAGAGDASLYRQTASWMVLSGGLEVDGELYVSGIGGTLFARKTADTSRASTTTQTDDPHLSVSLDSSAVYVMDAYIRYGNSGGDFLFDFSIPAGATGSWSTIAPSTTVGSDPDVVRVVENVVDQARTFGWFANAASDEFGAILRGLVVTGGSSGNYAFQWAQATSSGTAAIVYTHSWLRLTRVA